MIHIFNRAELILTPDLPMVQRIRHTLEEAGMEYRVVVKNSLAMSTARSGRAGNVPGNTSGSSDMYTIYVRRADLAYAEHLIK